MNAAIAEIRTIRSTLKREGFRLGFKSLWRTYGWKMVAVVFVYYIVRDVTLYVILPFLLVKGIS